MQQIIMCPVKRLACAALVGLALGACNSESNNDDNDSGASGAGATAGSGGVPGGGGNGGQVALIDHPADDPNIAYTGRIDFRNPKQPRYAAPGVYVQARFRGSALTVKIQGYNESGRPNYLDVLVDDNEPMKIKLDLATTDYPYTLPLTPGEHTVTLVKRTEASVGYLDFLGFSVDGPLLPPPPRPERRIEIIGDSISAGSGLGAANGSAQCMESYGEPWSNGYESYGAVAARALDAEYHITAVSGMGLIQNYSQQWDPRPMPEVYDTLFFEQKMSPLWDTAQFEPHAVVLMLGTNDFSPGDGKPGRVELDPEMYAQEYISFVDTLRTYYPEAHYFALSSPMLGDGYPDASKTYATDLKTALDAVEAHYAELEDTKFHKVFVTKLSGRGCGTHPNAAQHAQLAGELEQALRTALDW
ncbi:MAG TPA: SGNH/GDSL hydrolase family protein [Polyangiaceae bacterium]|nr:SGNH/GDSL hydrolase family protein [Polyangiaceae bacterium]